MSKHILLIEDDPVVVEAYVHELVQHGYTIDYASNGQEGLAKLASITFDLILLDIMLPGMNGIDVLKQIKTNEKIASTPVVVLTNLGQEGVYQEAINQGITGYLLKVEALPSQLAIKIDEFFKSGEFKSSDVKPTQ